MNSQRQQTLRQALKALLRAEFATLQRLDKALETEYETLLADSPEALEQATGNKVTAIDSHREQQVQRLQWMDRESLPGDQSFASLASLVDGEAELEDLQAQLVELANRCQENNRRNGGLILRLQERTRGALDVLRGSDSKGDLYSLSGAREHHADGRSLGKA